MTAKIVGSNPEERVALLTVSGNLRDAIVAQYREQWAKTGNLVDTGGRIASNTILSVVGAATGSAGLSAALSGPLFIATANPATLMAIQGGFGSAVVGASGAIVGQAPFISVSSVILPVATPLIVFQAISTFVVIREFVLVRESLVRVEKALERVLHRTEATFASELIALFQRLESLEEQFSDERRFSTDMIVRLALIEERVSALCERYKLLSSSQNITADVSETDLDFKIHDSRFAVISSSMNLRISYLRLALSLQESPVRMTRQVENFLELCDQHDDFLREIKTEGEKTQMLVDDLDKAIRAMGGYKRSMPGWLLGRRAERVEYEKASKKLQQHRQRQLEVERQEISSVRDAGQAARSALNGADNVALVYWKDEFGEHSYYVDRLPYYVDGLGNLPIFRGPEK